MRILTGEKLEKELLRLDGMLEYERQYAAAAVVCGVDEAGRGPLAGPVVAGAVVLPKGLKILHLNDSKKLSEKRREALYLEIKEKAVSWNVGIVGPEVIDQINILQATYEAMRQAVSGLSAEPDVLLNDAVLIPGLSMHQEKIIHGDAKSLSIAAASVMAKVTRDHMMIEYDKQFPEYGFAKHKGYGTAAHMQALREYGPCPIHRRTFLDHLGEKPNRRQTGRQWEEKAAGFLMQTGYEILEHNFSCRQGEIDLIAREGGYLVFVEVKYRRNLGSGSPQEAVDPAKQEKIRQTARYYLYRRGYREDTPCRFDVVAATGGRFSLIRDAF